MESNNVQNQRAEKIDKVVKEKVIQPNGSKAI